jgi:hypothetical protein
MSNSTVEQELWNVFTFYTLHGNPMYPDLLKASQFVKLSRECNIIKTKGIGSGVTQADVNVVYIIEVKRRDRGFGRKQAQMTYNDFLNALMRLSSKVYPRADTVDDAFQQLLMENVLPLASRRSPDPVSMHMENEEVQDLFAYFSDALFMLYQFYATAADAKRRKNTNTRNARKHVNSMKECLGYNEFLRFALDFNLSSNVILSTLEIGDIYLSSIKVTDGQENIRKLTFAEFWEALVRCALVAYSKISNASPGDKIRGLFLYMWRSINDTVPRAIEERRNVTTYMGDLINGSMAFNVKFTAMWAKDGYRDYLSPKPLAREEARDVLSRLLTRPKSGNALLEEVNMLADMKTTDKDNANMGENGNDGGEDGDGNNVNMSGKEFSESQLSELLARRPSIADMLNRNLNQ